MVRAEQFFPIHEPVMAVQFTDKWSYSDAIAAGFVMDNGRQMWTIRTTKGIEVVALNDWIVTNPDGSRDKYDDVALWRNFLPNRFVTDRKPEDW